VTGPAGGALGVMAGGYAAGAVLALLAPSQRAARLVTAVGAAAGCLGDLAAALSVWLDGRPIAVSFPGLVAAAGGFVIDLDPLGALFLALVAVVGLLAALYGASDTAALEGNIVPDFPLCNKSFNQSYSGNDL